MSETAQITFTCPNAGCGKKLRVGVGLAGKVVPCPACKSKLKIPDPDSDLWSKVASESGFPEGVPREAASSLGVRFRLIPAGEFIMGSDREREIEKPTHRIRITKAFYMGVTPVTNEQYEELMGKSPSLTPGARNPVEQVKWIDTQRFCSRLSEKEKRIYRLPTEAEWEYACRAGTTSDFYFGDDEDDIGKHAWYVRNSDEHPHEVGLKPPNPWGLYDMLGNVWEWCNDWFSTTYYAESPTDDPPGPPKQTERVLRGGSYINRVESCKCATRSSGAPTKHIRANGGFRIVMEIPR
ncbi:MAG TPA: formylglycine-generating enzyme family protein [Candidatus Brocadiia bacterium]|nr:formylglycine-generating enzyme family protein [Candidatus Brocadiia bacterium]